MKPNLVRLLPLTAALALAACGQSAPVSPASPMPGNEALAVPSEDGATPANTAPTANTADIEAASEAEYLAQEKRERAARAAADPVVGVVERAELCLHFGGEEGYDAARRAQIDKAFKDEKCDTVVADADALKARRPQDAKRLDAAVADLRN